jgi:hypothetical protein
MTEFMSGVALREYTEMMKELKQEDWPALKAKLSSPEAPILKLLHSYLDAKREVKQAWRTFTDGGSAVEFTKAYQRELRIWKELIAQL